MTRSPAVKTPAFKGSKRDLIPGALLRAMFGLALAALAISTYAVLSGREPSGQPQAAAVVRETQVILQGKDAQAVIVRRADGSLLADLPHGGFITVIQSGLATERKKYNVDPLLPIRIVEYANGRLVAEDPETGWSAELYAFGSDNKAAWVALLDQALKGGS